MTDSPLVMIVEDLEYWQDALSEILIEAGYRVCCASSHTEALEVLAQEGIHLAIIDPVLDDANRRNRDGLRVLQHILAECPHISSMVVTSSEPHRIRREVAVISPDVPLLWKDEWDDDRFLAVVDDLLSAKRF